MTRSHMRELRKQQIIKMRLDQARVREGCFLPQRIPVTFEALQDVKDQLEAHLAKLIPHVGSMN